MSKLSDKDKLIEKAIKYVKKYENMKYTPLIGKKYPTKDGAPLWIGDTSVEDKFDMIYKRGSVCAGLMNVLRRYMDLELPGNITGMEKSEFVGGTGEWFKYLDDMKRLEEIDFNKVYPKGTLLLQNYNLKDQGHLAMTINSSKNGLLNTKIIHAVRDKPVSKYNKTIIEKLGEYPNYKRFTHICYPENWLIKN